MNINILDIYQKCPSVIPDNPAGNVLPVPLPEMELGICCIMRYRTAQCVMR